MCVGFTERSFVRATATTEINTSPVVPTSSRPRAEYALGLGVWSVKMLLCHTWTLATAQATRAMCAGCVPIFIAPDVREPGKNDTSDKILRRGYQRRSRLLENINNQRSIAAAFLIMNARW
jgi:hypothetical protein